MKIHITLLLLLTIVSLLGCNTLVTKPNSGHTATTQKAVDNAAMKMVETDSPVNLSLRIDNSAYMASTQFSTTWEFEKEQKPLTPPQNLAWGTPVNSENGNTRLAKNSQTGQTTITKPLAKTPKIVEFQQRKMSDAQASTGQQIQKTPLGAKILAEQPTQKIPLGARKTLTEQPTQKTPLGAKILAERPIQPKIQVKVSKPLPQKGPVTQAKVTKSAPIVVAQKTEQRVNSQQSQFTAQKPAPKTHQASQVKISKSIAPKHAPKTSQISQPPQRRTFTTTRPPVKSTVKAKWTERRPNANQLLAKIIAETKDKKTNNSRPISGKNDLWARIRNGYGFSIVDNARIERAVNEFARHPSYFKRIASKASPYLYEIVKTVEKHGLPLELALLPAIESAYEAMALSHRSAAGLWQFMPATGKEYGLVQNRWYDGRRDIIQSTNAALTYLKRLNRMFDGDWFLALAAYNYGPGNMRKAINKNLAREKPTDFWSLHLPKETSRYVPKLLALTKILANPQQYGIQLQSIANQPYLKQIRVGHQMNLSLARRLAGLSPKEFKRLNPGYRRGVTAPDGPYDITVPIEKASLFEQRLAKIPTHLMLAQLEKHQQTVPQRVKISRSVPVQQLVVKNEAQQQHQVNRGDTLWSISKRYGTSLTSLSQLNGMKTTTPLKRGMLLKIPTTVAIAQKSGFVSKQTQIIHTVRPKEGLYSIARHYKVTVDKLAQWNKLEKNESLRIGQRLKILLEE